MKDCKLSEKIIDLRKSYFRETKLKPNVLFVGRSEHEKIREIWSSECSRFYEAIAGNFSGLLVRRVAGSHWLEVGYSLFVTSQGLYTKEGLEMFKGMPL